MRLLLLVTLTGWYRERHRIDCYHSLTYCAPHLSSNHSQFINHSPLLWLPQRHLVAKQEETLRNMASKYCL
jgi:hypothetical protein